MNRPAVSYKNHRFPPQIIAHAVWLYFRFPLSLQLVEEMLLERGIVVSYETIRRWARKFGAAYAKRLRRKMPSRKDAWHLDEVVISIGGRKHWLWRAVDQDDYVLDEIVQSRRDTKTARRLLLKLLKKQGLAPKRIVTDKRRSTSTTSRRSTTVMDTQPDETGREEAEPDAFIVRLGGEEFAALLPRRDHSQALNRGSAIASRFAEVAARAEGLKTGATVSIGLAAPDCHDLAGMLASADGALYRAKALGRNALRPHGQTIAAAALDRSLASSVTGSGDGGVLIRCSVFGRESLE